MGNNMSSEERQTYIELFVDAHRHFRPGIHSVYDVCEDPSAKRDADVFFDSLRDMSALGKRAAVEEDTFPIDAIRATLPQWTDELEKLFRVSRGEQLTRENFYGRLNKVAQFVWTSRDAQNRGNNHVKLQIIEAVSKFDVELADRLRKNFSIYDETLPTSPPNCPMDPGLTRQISLPHEDAPDEKLFMSKLQDIALVAFAELFTINMGDGFLLSDRPDQCDLRMYGQLFKYFGSDDFEGRAVFQAFMAGLNNMKNDFLNVDETTQKECSSFISSKLQNASRRLLDCSSRLPMLEPKISRIVYSNDDFTDDYYSHERFARVWPLPLPEVRWNVFFNNPGNDPPTKTFYFVKKDYGASFSRFFQMNSYEQYCFEGNRCLFIHLGVVFGVHPFELGYAFRAQASIALQTTNDPIHNEDLEGAVRKDSFVDFQILSCFWPEEFGEARILLIDLTDDGKFEGWPLHIIESRPGATREVILARQKHHFFLLEPQDDDYDKQFSIADILAVASGYGTEVNTLQSPRQRFSVDSTIVDINTFADRRPLQSSSGLFSGGLFGWFFQQE